jgi:L-seryl-tRNA(Ser) seleniumtransferase
MLGYTEAVSTAELAQCAHEQGLLMMEDLGSGALAQHPTEFMPGEPRVQQVLADGADLVCFSGDKLLGSTQAGILLGRREFIERLRGHPLARVLRLDKLHLAALEATLLAYLEGEAGIDQIPLYRMLRRSDRELEKLAQDLAADLSEAIGPPWKFEPVVTEAAMGGGSLPGRTIASRGLIVRAEGFSMEALGRFLREADPAILGRMGRDGLVLDLRTVLEDEWVELARLLREGIQVFSRRSAEGDP